MSAVHTQRLAMLWILLTGIIGILNLPATALDLDSCNNELGMQTGEIPDWAITASSSYDPASVGPTNARIRTETNGGAWCPQQAISKEVYEYLEVDLQKVKVITMIETQGRFGHGQGQEYADQYLLEYQREDGGTWFRFKNRRDQEIIPGNTNTYIPELRELKPPIIARRVRFIPYSTRRKTVCMRVEMYGCEWPDGTIQYNMPQGETRGTEVDLQDWTYDGTRSKDARGHFSLSGGLGQLTDGDQGQSNFRLDPMGLRIKGYEWIGWRNETFNNRPVEMVFKFDAVRNFTTLRLYSNNMFSKDVRVFRQAKIWFSVGGRWFPGEPVDFHYMRDTLMEYLRPVIIPLANNVGQYVKIQLFFDAKWMLLSEVSFESEYAVGNLTEESAPESSGLPDGPAGGSTVPAVETIDIIEVIPGDPKSNYNRTNKGRGKGRIDMPPTPRTPDNATSDPQSPGSPRDGAGGAPGGLEDQQIGVIIGALLALILLLFAVIVLIIMRHRRHKYASHRSAASPPSPPGTKPPADPRLTDIRNGKVSNGNMYNFVATMSDGESDREGSRYPPAYSHSAATSTAATNLQHRKLPSLPKTPESSGTDTSRSGNYAVPGELAAGLMVKLPGGGGECAYQASGYRVTPTAPAMVPGVLGSSSPYATTDVVPTNLPNIQGVSGNNVYAVPANLDFLWADHLAVPEFPSDKLSFVSKLGEGQFGEVHLCEASGLPDLVSGEDGPLGPRADCRSFMVAVKMLRRNANEHARSDFQKEVKILSRLKDPNIVRVLGVCGGAAPRGSGDQEPLSVVVEYMKYGDLHQYLARHVLEGTNNNGGTLSTGGLTGTLTGKRKQMPQLSYGCLIYMAAQIASGMKYLETLNMVHRDLASRNCLVGNAYTIKISDFGMSRSLYSSDYYRIEGKAVLPIRWMAWECVLLGKFSTKSDVWSFGVTLWEILSLAREQPHDVLTDEEVIDNCGHLYRADGRETLPPLPPACPREIYDLMCECWNRDEALRPAFREIHMFLSRKSVGYNPLEDKQRVGLGLGVGTLPHHGHKAKGDFIV